jgi:hypothetical protein
MDALALRLLLGHGASEEQEEAAKYVRRKNFHAGCSSTLRKASRAQRIASGERPHKKPRARLEVPNYTTRRVGKVIYVVVVRPDPLVFELHPTKGWRRWS